MKKRKQSYEPLTIEVVAVELERGYMTSTLGGGDVSGDDSQAAITSSVASTKSITSNVLF